MINEAYIKSVSRFGSDVSYALYHTPTILQSALDDLQASLQIDDVISESAYGYLGQLVCNDDMLPFPHKFMDYSYGCWTTKVDLTRKSHDLATRFSRRFTAIEMNGLYSVLANNEQLGVTHEQLQQCGGMLLTGNQIDQIGAFCTNETSAQGDLKFIELLI